MAYEPAPRKYENKQWCYEMYWGTGLSCPQMAALCPSSPSSDTIHRVMDEMGIPRRSSHWHKESTAYEVRDDFAIGQNTDDENAVDWSVSA